MTSVTLQQTKSNLKQTEPKPPPSTHHHQQQQTMEEPLNIDKHTQFKLKKEKDDFLQRLIEFHRHKNINTPLISWPTFNGRSLDLYKLFTKVLSLGGWETVCDKDKWNEIGEYLDKSNMQACTNGGHALRLIYIRYLSMFEKFVQTLNNSNTSLTTLLNDSHLFQSALNTFQMSSTNLGQQMSSTVSILSMSGSVGSNLKDKILIDDKSDELALISKRKFSYLIDSNALTYNYNQHNYDLSSTSKLTYNPYEKLEISLISGLPNEVDFAFNTILLLSSDEYHLFRIYQSNNLINLMLAHIGFFGSNQNDTLATSYRNLYDKVWNTDKCRRNFVKFWHNCIQAPVSLDDECYDDNYDSSNLNKLITSLLPQLYNQYLKSLPSKELLNLDCDYIIKENESKLVSSNRLELTVELRRIEQVLVTLNNLSFEENNADFMANKSKLLIEFLIMCIYCSNSQLKKHALDILSHLSRKIKLKNFSDKHVRLLLMSLNHLIVGTNSAKLDDNNPVRDFYEDQTQDRLDLLKGLEILTKLFAQQIDPCVKSIDYANEAILAQYYLNEMTGVLFLSKILVRLEQLLTAQDIFLLINTLECLYQMSQFNEQICNLIVSYQTSAKLVSMLVNFLTVDMSHFTISNETKIQSNTNKPTSQNIKIYKICNSNNIGGGGGGVTTVSNQNIPNSSVVQQHQQAIMNNNNTTNNSNQNNNKINNQNNLTSLLQQTLNNQHHLNTTNSSQQNSNNNTVSALLNSKLNTNQTTTNGFSHTTQRTVINSNNNAEHQAKSVLCNWLRTCFQTDPASEISKTKLYPYYQQIAKMNNWNVLTIPTFFEILNATFPNLRHNDTTNQIMGLKLAVNVKQQLQIKKEELIQQAEADWPVLPSNINNIKAKSTGPLINTTPSLQQVTTQTSAAITTTTTKSLNGHTTDDLINKNTELDKPTTIVPANKIPTSLTTINVITPSILPLLTPPTPPPQSTTPQTDENLNNLTNGTSNLTNTNINSIKQASKLLNDTSNVKQETTEQQTTQLNEKKFEKIISKSDEQVLNKLEQKLVFANNENNIKTNGINSNEHVKLNLNGNLNQDEKTNLTNGTSNKHVLTNGHTNSHSCSSSESSMSSEDEQENETNNNNNNDKMEQDEDEDDDDDGQIESFRKRKHDIDETRVSNQIPNNDNINTNNNITKSDEKDSNETKEPTKQEDYFVKKQKIEETIIITKSISETNGEVNVNNSTSNNNNTDSVPSQVHTPPPTALTPIPTPSPAPTPQVGDYICEWNNCKMSFNSVKSIYNHVCKYHLLNTDTNPNTQLNSNSNINNNGSLCLWIGCDQIRRQKWSLVNHVQERHCNENALKCAIMYRQRGLVPVSSSTNGAILNYAKDAAFIAIQKNQRKNIDDFIATEEGPVSKTIRLLSALTLRNLARNSEKAKLILKSHESVLTDIAFDLLESSNVLANCLWHLSN